MPELLTQNSKLKKTSKELGKRVFNFGMTAWKTAHGDIVCPYAKDCVVTKTLDDGKGIQYKCYAQMGMYNFPNVKKAYLWRLEQSKTDEFVDMVINEIRRKRVEYIRIHDSGDFYNRTYVNKWLKIMELCPDVRFYAYTKSVPLFIRRMDELPSNFDVIFSDGSTHEHLVDKSKHRFSSVFNSITDLIRAGYANASELDLFATKWFTENNKIGLIYH